MDFHEVVSLLWCLINPLVFQRLGAKEQMEMDRRLTTTSMATVIAESGLFRSGSSLPLAQVWKTRSA